MFLCVEVKGIRWLTSTHRTRTSVAVPWSPALKVTRPSFLHYGCKDEKNSIFFPLQPHGEANTLRAKLRDMKDSEHDIIRAHASMCMSMCGKGGGLQNCSVNVYPLLSGQRRFTAYPLNEEPGSEGGGGSRGGLCGGLNPGLS